MNVAQYRIGLVSMVWQARTSAAKNEGKENSWGTNVKAGPMTSSLFPRITSRRR
jgi:hypothetical protein